VEVQPEELVPGLVDQGWLGRPTALRAPLHQDGKGPGEPERDPPARGAQAGQLGDAADELALAPPLAVREGEDLADGLGNFGRKEDAINQILYVNAVERLVARSEVRKSVCPKGLQKLGKHGPVARAVNEAGADDGQR